MAPMILLVRHGEKPATGLQGVKLDGSASEHSLIPRGWQRAGALARFFGPISDRPPTSGLPVPQVLIAASPKAPGADKSEKSEREKETIMPVAELLAITPHLEFGKGEEADVAALAISCNQPVLIVWEHENIPKLGRAIAPSATIPAAWPSERFDMVWVFRPNVQGNYDFSQLPQLLLAGDSAQPIM